MGALASALPPRLPCLHSGFMDLGEERVFDFVEGQDRFYCSLGQ